MSVVKKTVSADVLPLIVDEHELAIINAVRLIPGRVGFTALNAYRHLKLAAKIIDLDPEMAKFRIITAQEEAASALLFSLKEKCYPGHEYINPKNHVHKAAVAPVAQACIDAMKHGPVYDLKIAIHNEKPSVSVTFRIENISGTFRSDTPLEMAFSQEVGGNMTRENVFSDELMRLLGANDDKGIFSAVKKRANERNLLLYASDNGMPLFSKASDHLTPALHQVDHISVITLCIHQTNAHQFLAIQALDTFLRALKRIEGTGFDFESYRRGSDASNDET